MKTTVGRFSSSPKLGTGSQPLQSLKSNVWALLLSACCFLFGVNAHVLGQTGGVEEQNEAKVTRSKATVTSAELLRKAFSAEIDGDFDARRELLENALSTKGTGRPQPAVRDLAQWSLGKLKDDRGRWVSLDDWIANKSISRAIEAYESLRDNSFESLDAHKSLAMFCMENGLNDQARVHFAQILTQEPDHVAARMALGYVRVGPTWMSQEQLAMLNERQNMFRVSLQNFRPRLMLIAEGLKSNSSKGIKAATESLQKIDSDLAIPAMEVVFGDESEEVTTPIVQWLSRREGQEASIALAHFGIFHPVEGVRRAAAEALQERPVVEYGAAVMDMVLTPFSPAGVIPIQASVNGPVLGFQKSYRREGAERDQVFIANTDFNGAISLPQRIELLNAQTRSINLRVSELLSTISGRSISPETSDLWDWWYQEMETSRPETRRLASHWSNELLHSYAGISLNNRSGTSQFQAASFPDEELLAMRPFRFRIGLPWRSSECFVAGTPVMTQKGFRAIETIRMGDLVLSKNIETGELAFRPVVRTTERTPIELVTVTLPNESFVCTPGHLFWVSGRGWTRARELTEGDVLHGAIEPTEVLQVSVADQKQTYNLVVEEHSNYFVGESLVLSHDVTSHEYRDEVIPGLQTETN